MATKVIFSPVKIGNTTLQHRVVLAPLTRNRNTLDHVPNDLVKEYYEQRSSEGGLLITEATLISPLAGGYPQAPGIWNKEQIEAWKNVTDTVHEKKGVIYCQLWHAGRTSFNFLSPNREQPVSASAIRIKGSPFAGIEYQIPHALTIPEIKSVIEDFRQAAINAIEAGFDGIELHGANGYLIDQFIRTSANKRTDIYGGSIENRARFALEVVDAVADAIGAERTAIRFSPGNPYQDMEDETPVETFSYLTSELQKRHPNLAFLHFMQSRLDEDSLVPYRNIWKGPFISNGYSNAEETAINLAEKTGDLIAFGRSFISNPDLPERLRNGWELNPYDRFSFYTHEPEGYTDYPFYNK